MAAPMQPAGEALLNNIQDLPASFCHLRFERLNHRDNERILLGQGRYLFRFSPDITFASANPRWLLLAQSGPRLRLGVSDVEEISDIGIL